VNGRYVVIAIVLVATIGAWLAATHTGLTPVSHR
jgi:hypothetical protein